MIVLDASALLELLLGTEPGREIAARIEDPGLGLHVPHADDLAIYIPRHHARDEDLVPHLDPE